MLLIVRCLFYAAQLGINKPKWIDCTTNYIIYPSIHPIFERKKRR